MLLKSLCKNCKNKCSGKRNPKPYNISQRLMSDFQWIKVDSDFFEFKGGMRKQPFWYQKLWVLLTKEYDKNVKEQQARTKKNGNARTKTKSYS